MLAEDLLLLMLDDRSGSPTTDPTTLDFGLAGAVLIELSLTERLQIGGGSRLRRAKVTVADAAPTGNEVLDAALTRIAATPTSAERLVRELAKGLRQRLLERLVRAEVLHEEHSRVLGVFPRHRWPAASTAREDALRRRLREVLIGGATPDPRTAALVCVLSSMKQADKVVQDADRKVRQQAGKRAQLICEGEWASQAVRRAIKASQDATTAAMAAATVAATVSAT